MFIHVEFHMKFPNLDIFGVSDGHVWYANHIHMQLFQLHVQIFILTNIMNLLNFIQAPK